MLDLEESAEKNVTAVEIEEETKSTFIDFSTFWAKNSGYYQGGRDFCKNEQRFNQALKELKRSLPFPFPLVKCWLEDSVIEIVFSREIVVPAAENLPEYA